MAGNRSRNKGGRGEREVMGILQPIVDKVCERLGKARIVIRRNRDQRYAAKQYDLIGVPWLCLEVKYQESYYQHAWWRQTLAACGPRQIPVLVYRKNHRPWRVKCRIPLYVGTGVRVRANVTMDIEDFCIWFEQYLLLEMK